MKVCSLPDDVPAPEIDFKSFDPGKVRADEDAHKAKLKQWLLDAGYKGPHTGEILSIPVADGFALYMVADGKRACLLHLPYGDGYRYPDVAYLPKAEVLKRIESRKGLAKLFANAS